MKYFEIVKIASYGGGESVGSTRESYGDFGPRPTRETSLTRGTRIQHSGDYGSFISYRVQMDGDDKIRFARERENLIILRDFTGGGGGERYVRTCVFCVTEHHHFLSRYK